MVVEGEGWREVGIFKVLSLYTNGKASYNPKEYSLKSTTQ